MITSARQPNSDEPDVREPNLGELRAVRELAREALSARRGSDAYASAELHRRHERTESIIRKAHEQFS